MDKNTSGPHESGVVSSSMEDARMQYEKGMAFYRGKGVEKNFVKAVKWFRRAAEQGDADAQFYLGLCYKNGEGVEKDRVKAVEWWTKAAEQGYAAAQNSLGWCYQNGQGVEKDPVKAVEWWFKAAEQGYARAQYRLGVCYDNGEGVEKDLVKAVEWFTKAAEQGYASASSALKRIIAENPDIFLQALIARNKGAVLGLISTSPDVNGSPTSILKAAIDTDDMEVLETICNLPNIDLNASIDGVDALKYAESKGLHNSVAVFLSLLFAKSARIMIVGAEASGKTRLRKLMQQRPYRDNSTDLLEIDHDWVVDGVQLKVWDFAGQSGYYAAQHFFLGDGTGEGSLFCVIVCFDVRKRDDVLQQELEEWFSRVCRNAKESKPLVAFVGTWIDKASAHEIEVATTVVERLLKRHSAIIECLKPSESQLVWQSSPSKKAVQQQQLLRAIIDYCGKMRNRLASKATHQALAQVREHVKEGENICYLSNVQPPINEELLLKLHDMGEVFYRAGANVVSTDILAPLKAFKVMLKLCHRSLPKTNCEMPWTLLPGLWDAHVAIEHNELQLSLGGKPVYDRVHLNGARVEQVQGDGLNVEVKFRDGSSRVLRFSVPADALEFQEVVKANSNRHTPDCRYQVLGRDVGDALHGAGFVDRSSQSLVLDMLMSNGVLQYLVPFLFPKDNVCRSEDVIRSDDVALCNHAKCRALNLRFHKLYWNYKDYRERHGRKYVINQDFARSQAQALVLQLCGVMRDAQQRQCYWNGDASIGAWQTMEGRKAFYEFVLVDDTWSLYIMLSAIDHSGSLMKMIVRLHDVVTAFFQSSATPHSLYVALDTDAVNPTTVGKRKWNFKFAKEITDDQFLLLLPEQRRNYAAVDPKDRNLVMCVWCVAPSGKCNHPWTVGPGFVATGYIGGGGQGHVLRGHQGEKEHCAIKVAERAVCDWEHRALAVVGGLTVRGARVIRILFENMDATLTGPQNLRHALILEMVEGSPLKGKYSEVDVVRLLRSMSLLLKEVHLLGVLHLDLKPPNLLRDTRNGDVVLVDFGACCINDERRGQRRGETTPWISPELSSGGAGNALSDVYSLGMTAFQLLCGLEVGKLSSLVNYVNVPSYARNRGPCSDALANLLGRMCSKTIESRPSLDDILNQLPGGANVFSPERGVSARKSVSQLEDF